MSYLNADCILDETLVIGYQICRNNPPLGAISRIYEWRVDRVLVEFMGDSVECCSALLGLLDEVRGRLCLK